jgi:hypothetical protein
VRGLSASATGPSTTTPSTSPRLCGVSAESGSMSVY